MLTRFHFRRDFRLIVRCLSDKPSDNDPKVPESQPIAPKTDKKAADANKERIQELLKSMMTAQAKISDTEYEEKFTVAPERKRKPKQDEIAQENKEIEKNLTKAAGEVAQAIGGDVKQTEAELLSKVLGKVNQTSTSLSDLIIGMKVDRSRDGEDGTRQESRGAQVKRLSSAPRPQGDTRFAQRAPRQERTDRGGRAPRPGMGPPQPTHIDIFSGQPLGIFKAGEANYGTSLEMWESLKKRELSLATAQPPANYFQKMIQWTEQGKVWKFPIDNEQGMEEEQNIHFSEHIFLDTHLEGWCPKKGPIRHFMELVCVGLSKNAFYTVQEKRDHIMWYKEYFETKKDVLTEVGAWDAPKSSQDQEAST